jgi:acylphosphatase
MGEGEKALKVRITGRVRGVGYRAWTLRQASVLGLRGWVRNEADGSVSALVGGTVAAVDRMLELFRSGPSGARVTGVAVHPADPSELPPGFRQAG